MTLPLLPPVSLVFCLLPPSLFHHNLKCACAQSAVRAEACDHVVATFGHIRPRFRKLQFLSRRERLRALRLQKILVRAPSPRRLAVAGFERLKVKALARCKIHFYRNIARVLDADFKRNILTRFEFGLRRARRDFQRRCSCWRIENRVRRRQFRIGKRGFRAATAKRHGAKRQQQQRRPPHRFSQRIFQGVFLGRKFQITRSQT